MGQHHGRSRADPAACRGGGRWRGLGRPDPAHGLAYQLLLSPSGTKFGKSEGGESVWLDPARTSPFAFYQYWLNTDDRDVGTYLRWFTELPRAEIEALEAEVAARPEARAAQRALALDITARTHGTEAAAGRDPGRSRARSRAALSGPGRAGVPVRIDRWLQVHRRRCSRRVLPLLLAQAGLFASNGEARRMIAGGGVTINAVRVTDPGHVPEPIAGEWLEVRIGKRRREIGRLTR